MVWMSQVHPNSSRIRERDGLKQKPYVCKIWPSLSIWTVLCVRIFWDLWWHKILGLDIKSKRMARQKEILVKHFKIELVTVHSHKKWDWIKLDINYSTNEESGGTSTWWIADSISCFSPASCGGGTLLFQTSCLPFHMWHKCANYGSITHRPLTIACSIKLQFSIPSVEPG